VSEDKQPPLELIDEERVDATTDRAIRRLLCECFPADAEAYAQSRAWHDATPAFSFVVRDAGQLLGHVSIVVREIRCDRTPVTVAGVQGLCVAARRRGTGLGPRLLTAARGEALRRGIRFGLLFCVPELEAYYGSQGWSRLDRPVTMLDEHGRPAPLPAKNIAMQIALAGEPLPAGPLDLRGRDW
jgi:predicted N-acetyltransferase YhbS